MMPIRFPPLIPRRRSFQFRRPRQILVGGDILLSVQGITMASAADRALVFKALETLKAGDDLRVTVFRDNKIVELAMKFTGF
jgi:S1-C subfamily serine protease